MMNVRKDLTGMVFGKLIVLSQAEDYIQPSGQRKVQWNCLCECGNHTVVRGSNLTRKNGTKSCGCLRVEKIKEVLPVVLKKYNEYTIEGDVVIGKTSNTNNNFYVDLKNFDKIKDYCWHEETYRKMSRLVAKDPKTKNNISMHTLLGYKNYDHIDRNELNNLESNLRPATARQNSINRGVKINNTSGVTGVNFDKNINKWIARINDKANNRIYLGSFINKEDAVIARLKGELKYYGEFSPQKHLYEEYGIKFDEENDI